MIFMIKNDLLIVMNVSSRDVSRANLNTEREAKSKQTHTSFSPPPLREKWEREMKPSDITLLDRTV